MEDEYHKSQCTRREFDPEFLIHILGVGLHKGFQLWKKQYRQKCHIKVVYDINITLLQL